MFEQTRNRRIRRRRARKPINWSEVAACTFLVAVGSAFFALCLGVIYYGG